MKKKVFGLFLIFGTVSTQINAHSLVTKVKEKLSFGIKAEGNYSNFILSDMESAESSMGVGGSIGTFIKFDITRNFAIQEDIMVTYQSSDFTKSSFKDTYQYLGAEVPIYAMGQWYTSNGGRIYAGLGPYFSMGISAKLKDSDTDLYEKANGERPMSRLVSGGAAQIGYEFNFGLQINASYKIGLTNALDAKSSDSKISPQSASIGIGYRF